MKNKHANGASSNPYAQTDVSFLKNKTILVTGGTGSFGKCFIREALKTQVRKIIVFSRDELKQSEMQHHLRDTQDRVRYFIGDIRDKQRLSRAFYGVDYVIHAAALKQVPALEYNPFEAVLTNIVGSENIIDTAIDQGVQRVVALSTDKAANPINLYGATKLCAEKLFIAGNSYAAGKPTRFSVVRYGNVIGSRGSVVPLFLKKREEGVLPITDERMTRFWITLEQGVHFVMNALRLMHGGEIFVPKIASMRITDLAKALAPKCKTKKVGVRPGEKIHEVLITDDEYPRTLDMGSFFVIEPLFPWWGNGKWADGVRLPEGFRYTSDSNDRWLTRQELAAMCEQL